MIAIVHSIYSQSVHAPALDAGLMDNDAERYCRYIYFLSFCCVVNSAKGEGERELPWHMKSKHSINERTKSIE